MNFLSLSKYCWLGALPRGPAAVYILYAWVLDWLQTLSFQSDAFQSTSYKGIDSIIVCVFLINCVEMTFIHFLIKMHNYYCKKYYKVMSEFREVIFNWFHPAQCESIVHYNPVESKQGIYWIVGKVVDIAQSDWDYFWICLDIL